MGAVDRGSLIPNGEIAGAQVRNVVVESPGIVLRFSGSAARVAISVSALCLPDETAVTVDSLEETAVEGSTSGAELDGKDLVVEAGRKVLCEYRQ